MAQGRRQGQGQRARIVAATGRLFRHKGYHGTSMADVGKAVGLEKGSLYTHISAKQEVLRELVEQGAALFLEGIAPVVAAEQPAPRKVRCALRAHLAVVAMNPDLAAVFLQEWRQLEGEALARITALRDDYECRWREIVAQGVREGAFRPDLDIRFAALLLLSAGNWAHQWFNPRGPLSAAEVADRFADLAMQGMARDQGPGDGALTTEGVYQYAPTDN